MQILVYYSNLLANDGRKIRRPSLGGYFPSLMIHLTLIPPMTTSKTQPTPIVRGRNHPGISHIYRYVSHWGGNVPIIRYPKIPAHHYAPKKVCPQGLNPPHLDHSHIGRSKSPKCEIPNRIRKWDTP